MKKRTPLLAVGRFVAVTSLFVLGSCGNLILTSPEQEMALGIDAYQQILTENQANLITSGAQYRNVVEIGNRIRDAALARAAEEGWDPQFYEWEVNLIQSDQVNAFCLPGGKIAVYTGILAVTQNDDALAGVMGHEVAHATMRHGGQRISQNLIVQGGLTAAAIGLSIGGLEESTTETLMGALGAGAQYGVLLPYSRESESEADLVGLRYMIEAGYDPQEVPKLWERMAALSSERPSEFMSTHPDPLNRAETIREAIPQMMRDAGRLKQIQQ